MNECIKSKGPTFGKERGQRGEKNYDKRIDNFITYTKREKRYVYRLRGNMSIPIAFL